MEVSVITPTIRPDGLELVEKALKRQTLNDFEWVVIAPQEIKINGFGLIDTLLSDPPKKDGLKWTLNRAYNKAISQAEGELIISWQDYTYAGPDVVERFLTHFKQEPNTIVTGVGDKYTQVLPYPMLRTWRDPRKNNEYGTYYSCNFNDIEGNFCSVPKRAFYDIGGFDEKLDEYFGMDFYGVLNRLSDLGGYDFKIDQTIESYSLEHDRPDGWSEYNALSGPYEDRKTKLKLNDNWPVLDYL